MKSTIRFLVLATLVSPVLAQEEEEIEARSFDVDHFSFNQSMEKFLFRGKVRGLPPQTQLIATISLRGEAGPSDAVYVNEESRFEGEFATKGKDVVAGTYVLSIHVKRDNQQGPVRELFPQDLEQDTGTKHCGWKQGSANTEWEKIRRAIVAECAGARGVYDRAAQFGHVALKKIDLALDAKRAGETLSGEEQTKLLGLWQPFYEETKDPAGGTVLEKRAREFEEKFVTPVFLSPYQKAVKGVVALYDFVDRLRSSYTVEILKRLGIQELPEADVDRGRFPVPAVISQINAVAWSIQGDLGKDVTMWEPTIEIAKERGALQGQTWVSATSGFKIDTPNAGWTLVTGEANSTMRLALNVQTEDGPCLATVMVHLVEFKWCTTKEELVDAWERLAEYEWPNYAKLQGEFVQEPGGKEHYLFRFRTRTDDFSTTVTCKLYFPKSPKRAHTIYGLMEVGFYEGIAQIEFKKDFELIMNSFELAED